MGLSDYFPVDWCRDVYFCSTPLGQAREWERYVCTVSAEPKSETGLGNRHRWVEAEPWDWKWRLTVYWPVKPSPAPPCSPTQGHLWIPGEKVNGLSVGPPKDGLSPHRASTIFFLTLKIYSKELLNIWRKPLSWQKPKQRGKSNRGNKAHIWQTENNFKKLIHISREMRRCSICQTSLWLKKRAFRDWKQKLKFVCLFF